MRGIIRGMIMRHLKNVCLALSLTALLSSMGCCYHAQHFGKKRDIGWGEIGCETCLPCDDGGCCPPTDCGTGCGTGVRTSAGTVEPPPRRLPETKVYVR